MGKFKVDDPNGFEPDSEMDVQTKNDLRELVHSTAWLEFKRIVHEENLRLRLDLSRNMVASSEDAARFNRILGFSEGIEHVFQRLEQFVEESDG